MFLHTRSVRVHFTFSKKCAPTAYNSYVCTHICGTVSLFALFDIFFCFCCCIVVLSYLSNFCFAIISSMLNAIYIYNIGVFILSTNIWHYIYVSTGLGPLYSYSISTSGPFTHSTICCSINNLLAVGFYFKAN